MKKLKINYLFIGILALLLAVALWPSIPWFGKADNRIAAIQARGELRVSTIHGQGVALANNVMAQSEIEAGRLVCPFNDVLVSKNAFYLVCHDSQAELGKIAAFRQWILAKAASEQEKFRFRYEQ